MEGSLDTQPMSAGELKARLYQTFRERGLVESLKSQLRTKLVAELRQNATLEQMKFSLSPKGAIPSASLDGSSSLMLRAANSMVTDHLRRCGYDYSMAVFLPESGSAEDKLFTVPDLLDLLRIPTNSRLYKKLAAELPKYESKGFLWQLLCELSGSGAVRQETVGVQVDEYPGHQSSIERKLQSVDDVYKQRSEEDEVLNRHSVQEKLLKLRRELEAKSREDTHREISRFKESELKRVELEEREKARRDIACARREIEKTYQAKSDALREREQATMERLHKHQELIERETYAQRQSLLEELRVIKQREADTRREAEVNSRAAQMEEDKRKAIEDNLKIRETSVANIEATYENRLREETKRFELDYEARVAKRLNELEQREAKVRAEQRSLTDERETMKGLREQLQGKARHVTELEALLKEAKSEALSAGNRSELLNERMRTMVDYPSLKEDNTILRRDLEHAKMRVAELASVNKSEQTRHEDLIRQLSERMARPSPELQALRSELTLAREQLSQEKASMQHMESQWNARLQEEREANKDLRHKLSEQTNEMASLMRQLADLKLALRQTQTALNNNINQPNRRFDAGFNNNSTLADDLYIDTSLHQSTLGPELRLADGNRHGLSLDASNRGYDEEDDDSSQSQGGDSLVFIEQTKARFRQLEMEAEHLEQNYQDLQHRMSGVGGVYNSPTDRVLMASTGIQRHTDVPMSREPDPHLHSPQGGSRHVTTRDSSHQSSSQPAAKHPRKHSGSLRSKAADKHQKRSKEQHQDAPPKEGVSPRGSDNDFAPPLSSSLSSSSVSASGTVSISMKMKASDTDSPDRKEDSMWAMAGQKNGANAEEKSLDQATPQNGHTFSQPLHEVSRSDEETERQHRADERRRKEEEQRERRREEEERAQAEGGKDREEEERRAEAERRRQLEEEEEQRAWEEKRRQKEEERRRKDQEARDREQRMLLELQKQEASGGAGSDTAEPKGSERRAEGAKKPAEEEEEKKDKAVEEEEKKDKAVEEEEEEAGGIKIDPVMQRYMMMVQQRKQQQETAPTDAAPQEPEVIPDDKSDGTFSIEEMEGGGMEDPARASDDNDDIFGDW